MPSESGGRFSRIVISFLELILKKIAGPEGWRPAGAVRELPGLALIYDAREEGRTDVVFRVLSDLGLAPARVAIPGSTGDAAEVCRAIRGGARGCWAAVVLEPEDESRAGIVGRAFRNYAHLCPEVVALVVGPLPSRAEILDRYRHVVTGDDGYFEPAELAAGIAHASAARVLHASRLLNTAVVVFSLFALAAALVGACVVWLLVGR